MGTGDGEQQIAAVDEEEYDSVASGEFFETVNVFLFSTICAVVAGLKKQQELGGVGGHDDFSMACDTPYHNWMTTPKDFRFCPSIVVVRP